MALGSGRIGVTDGVALTNGDSLGVVDADALGVEVKDGAADDEGSAD